MDNQYKNDANEVRLRSARGLALNIKILLAVN